MKFYRQKDYPNTELGEYGGITLATSGCFVVSLANLADRDPVEVNRLLAKNKCFVQGNMLANKKKTAELLGLEWNGRTTKKPDHTCIAETADNAKYGVPQHFFIYNPETEKMNDPLSAKREWEKCKYSIKSYRLFKEVYKSNYTWSKEKEEERKKEEKKEIQKEKPTLTAKQSLLNVLKIQSDIFDEVYKIQQAETNVEKKEHYQKILQKVSSTGRYIREAQAKIGLPISK